MAFLKRFTLLAIALVVGLGAVTAAPAQAIIGGDDASTDNRVVFVWTWTGNNYGSCSGAPIAPRVVLTAAHCVSIDLGSGYVRTPPENIFVSQPGANMKASAGIQVKQVFYPQCNQVTSSTMLSCDLAALVLAQPVSQVGIDRLGTAAELQTAIESRSTVTVLGYGKTQYNFVGSLTPRKVELNVSRPAQNIYDAGYGASWGAPGDFPLDTSPAKGVCQGDSGGPAIQVIDGKNVLLGLGSFLLGPCSDSPSAVNQWVWYTNVTAGGLYGQAISQALAAAAAS